MGGREKEDRRTGEEKRGKRGGVRGVEERKGGEGRGTGGRKRKEGRNTGGRERGLNEL